MKTGQTIKVNDAVCPADLFLTVGEILGTDTEEEGMIAEALSQLEARVRR